MCLVYYYEFYRILFESLDNWYVSSALQAVHLAHEWVMFPFRCTEFYYNNYLKYMNKTITWPCMRFVLEPIRLNRACMTLRDWQCFLCVDFSLRLCLMLFISFGYYSMILFLHYGYNRHN
eukprot:UN18644